MICKVMIFLLSADVFTSHDYMRQYTFERGGFVAGASPDLHYFSVSDIEKINNIYSNWLGTDYRYGSSIPNFTLGFESPTDGLYSYLFNEDVKTLTVIQDLY